MNVYILDEVLREIIGSKILNSRKLDAQPLSLRLLTAI